jgi:class 3 adenylate cyclase/alpha-beta hydrolase superfamily lysophospholipase
MGGVSKPETRYAKAGGINIAYQVVGEGPRDLVVVPGFVSHLELLWGDPDWVRGIERMASFARLILFDKRGTGLSDPAPVLPTQEERVDDIRAVMDAAGSEQAALFGFSEGAAMSLMLAASDPDRVTALILLGSLVTGTPEPGSVPWAERCVAAYDGLAEVVEHWGEGRLLGFMAPSLPQNELGRRLTGTLERCAASPAMAAALVEGMRRIDLGNVLDALDRPTLVMHRANEVWPVEAARDIANRIKGARYVELEGTDHWWWVGDQETLIGEVEEFLTGARQAQRSERTLATVLFTDIVRSTEVAAELGDTTWRALLGRHDALVREQIARFRGREIKATGDGFLATFDGPARGVECARTIIHGAKDLGIEIRAGLHAGECELIGDDVGGMAVHIGARIAALAGPGEVLVSGTVRDLVLGSELSFEERGTQPLKGVPGQWALCALAEDAPSTAPIGKDLDAPDRPPMLQRAIAGFAARQPQLSERIVGFSRRGSRGTA